MNHRQLSVNVSHVTANSSQLNIKMNIKMKCVCGGVLCSKQEKIKAADNSQPYTNM